MWGPNLIVKITSTDPKDMAGGTVDNKGTVTWDGGDLGGSSSSLFTNEGTFNAAGDLAIDYSPSGGVNDASFVNKGTFNKTSGTGAVTITVWGFDNYGTGNAQSGAIELHHGTHTLRSGSTLEGNCALDRDDRRRLFDRGGDRQRDLVLGGRPRGDDRRHARRAERHDRRRRHREAR